MARKLRVEFEGAILSGTWVMGVSSSGWLTLVWITERLGMGTKTHLTHLTHLLYWSQRDKKK